MSYGFWEDYWDRNSDEPEGTYVPISQEEQDKRRKEKLRVKKRNRKVSESLRRRYKFLSHGDISKLSKIAGGRDNLSAVEHSDMVRLFRLFKDKFPFRYNMIATEVSQLNTPQGEDK